VAQEIWDAVDALLGELLLEPVAALDAALEDSGAAELPAIQVAPKLAARTPT
jgi:hypothetical protein